MSLQSKREREVTGKKLRGLEDLYATMLAESGKPDYARELTLRSLRQSINQLKEEIARFEARTGSPSAETMSVLAQESHTHPASPGLALVGRLKSARELMNHPLCAFVLSAAAATRARRNH